MNYTKMILLVMIMMMKTVAVEGLIMGDLGDGWHYLIRNLRKQDLSPMTPTRSPRQIIGSRFPLHYT